MAVLVLPRFGLPGILHFRVKWTVGETPQRSNFLFFYLAVFLGWVADYAYNYQYNILIVPKITFCTSKVVLVVYSETASVVLAQMIQEGADTLTYTGS